MENILWAVAIFGVCAVIVVLLCRKAPIVVADDGEIERIRRIIASAKYHREQLEARADEMVRLHGYQWGSSDADDLASVIFDGEQYEEMLQRIMRRKVRA